jgi:hypothetical protein
VVRLLGLEPDRTCVKNTLLVPLAFSPAIVPRPRFERGITGVRDQAIPDVSFRGVARTTGIEPARFLIDSQALTRRGSCA